MRISELAEKLGVSTYTVSVALSGKPGVSEATRKRVVEAAAHFGYQPDSAGRMLRSGKSMQIGVAMPAPVERFYAKMTTFFQKELARCGFTPVFGLWGEDCGSAHDAYAMLERNKLDGLISWECLPELAHFSCPVVLYRTHDNMPEFDSVTIDFGQQIREMVDSLSRTGISRIGYIGLFKDPRAIALRKELPEHGLPCREEYFLPLGVEQWRDLAAGLHALSALKEPPEALAVSSDYIALRTEALLAQSGNWHPKIISFWQSDLLTLLSPGVSTFSLSESELAANMVSLLMRRIQTPDRPAEHIALKSQFNPKWETIDMKYEIN